MEFEPVIGLEVHAQLGTRSKIFCACTTAFGGEANGQTCPVCLGLPGALPVLNRRAAEFAVRMIVAVGGEVNPTSFFARKNYFYPDLPKGFQVSQFERPVGTGGVLRFQTKGQEQSLRLTRIHLEEDAGKSMHSQGRSLVDLNRCGVPLIEIVSEPELSTPEQASACLQSLRQLLRYLKICDGNMEEGSLRCDANVSVRPVGSTQLGTKTEVKNMNSFKAVERAIRFEIDRQINLVSQGGQVQQQTMLWDEQTGKAQPTRGKEASLDYRYFPEPDLVTLRIDKIWLDTVKDGLPELPAARTGRLVSEYGLPPYDAEVLTTDRGLADYFEETVKVCGAPKSVSNWVMGEVLRYLRTHGHEIEEYPVSAAELGALIGEIEQGRISGSAAKDVLEHLAANGGTAQAMIEKLGLTQVSDPAALEHLVDQVLAAEPQQAQEYRNGKTRVLGYLVGKVMQASKGAANPKVINELLLTKLGSQAP